MAQYTAGTVDVTNGSATVTGTGTAWLSEASQDDWFVGGMTQANGGGVVYDVAGVVSDTELTLSVPWQGATLTGQAYALHRDFSPRGFALVSRQSAQLDALINRNTTKLENELTRNITVQVYGASGSPHTWTKPTDLKFVIVRAQGPGGSGASCPATSAGEGAAGGGGAAGPLAEARIDAADLGATETVTVPEGGAAPAAGQNDGQDGGNGSDASFGAHVIAGFGQRGFSGPAGSSGINDGGSNLTGNTAVNTGQSINTTEGAPGGHGVVVSGLALSTNHGGASPFHGGGRATKDSDGDAAFYGAGGAGANAANGEVAHAGGKGGDARIEVWEFF